MPQDVGRHHLCCNGCASKANTVPFGLGERYILRRLLKPGGMGYVFAADDRSLGRDVALKIPILPTDDPERSRAVERFRTEIQAIQSLHHPNINRVLDDGHSGEYYYYVMPYLCGGTLGERLAAAPRPEVRESVEWVLAIADAMTYSHAIGVVHRDLKPSNLIFDESGVLLVTDFGLALFTDDPLMTRITNEGDIIGSPFYMSPEQARGMPKWHGPSCDIYSLGVILYETITGQKPFAGNGISLINAIRAGKPRKPRSINPKIDLTLEKICLSAMALLIDDRYPTMQEFATALARYLGRPERLSGAALLVEVGPERPNIYRSGRRGIEMAKIPPGEFVMGSEADELERPPSRVRIETPFLISVNPVTQSLYEAITGSLPLSAFRGRSDRPVDTVSWSDAIRFCNLLSVLDGIEPYYSIDADGRIVLGEGTGYRLPTEAEWEYACRGGCTGSYCYGDDTNRLVEFAWYAENSGGETHEVGKLAPNFYGLHDIHGNLWEWCWDWYAPYRKARPGGGSAVVDPRGPDNGHERVLRGGCWNADSHRLRSTARNYYFPMESLWYFGFRLTRSLKS
ncbi:MAG: bifunctional serine/threonine-protein kinase/formylglycine-generating enzyme family protein [Isosphaeraceae bacterium]|nr:bifunctional serine/threonine-protein kinase/formylglycine-generating enzyme family protein [Isosphaeraceae bacterium]